MTEPNLTALSGDELKEYMKDMMPPGLVEEEKIPEKRKICLGILSYDGKVHCRTMMCMVQAVMQCAAKGWGFTYILRESDSMVARGRSFLASQFLENPEAKDCTDLVFVDLDLSWNGDELIRLLEHPVDVIGAAYPYKDESGDFPLRWPADGLFEENGLWVVQAVTPGFFRVTRKALLKIAKEMPWLEFKDRGTPEGHRNWMFFDNLQRPSGIYDEGYIFCERWRTVGGKTYLDPDINLSHIGLKSYNHGTLRQWLDKKAKTFDKLESEYPGIPPLKLMQKALGAKVDLDDEMKKVEAAMSPAAVNNAARDEMASVAKTRRKPKTTNGSGAGVTA